MNSIRAPINSLWVSLSAFSTMPTNTARSMFPTSLSPAPIKIKMSADPKDSQKIKKKTADHSPVRVFTRSDLITGSDRIGPEIGYLAHF